MGCEVFREKRFNTKTEFLIEECNQIINEYLDQDLRLTLRQLYYQLVSRDKLPNTPKSYKNLGNAVSDARLAGLIDWHAIEDRVRVPRVPAEWEDLNDLVQGALAAYRLPRWKGQKTYCELWVEKDALAGVLQPLAHEFHVTMMVNRGYSSQSAMYEASKRFIRHSDEDTECYIFYLGDHDPSGEDMVRDIRDRLVMFGAELLTVDKIALTMAQIKKYKPPPNPAKVTDPRAEAYIREHGRSSWEVDALPPDVLQEIIRSSLSAVVDEDLMEEVKVQEAKDKVRLLRAVKELK